MGFSHALGPHIIKSVERSAENLPQSTQTAKFTVTGKVLLLQLVSEVTTIIETQANATKWVYNPTTGADSDLCATLDITGDAVGVNYGITGTPADALAEGVSRVDSMATPVVLGPGTVDLDCAASNTGQIKTVLHYIPLEPGSTVTAA